MYLKTPKRYTAKGSRRPLLNLRWLWLYLLAPIILIPAVLVWDFRDSIQPNVALWFQKNIPKFSLPVTPTPTVPPADLQNDLKSAFTTGRINRAISSLNMLGDTAPNEVGVHSLVTQLLVLRSYSTNQEMLDAANKAGQRAINANPEDARGWIVEALVLDWSNKPQEALGYALRAKDLDEKNSMVLAILAEIYSDLQKNDQASKFVDDAIAAAKTATPVDRAALSHAHYVRARILESQDGKASIAALEEAWRVAVSDPDVSVPSGYIAQLLASDYTNLAQPERAVKLLTDAIKRDQDDPILVYQRAKAYLNLGDQNKARIDAETCTVIDPNQRRCHSLMGMMYYREQNYQQAVQSLEKAATLGSQDPLDYLRAGLSYGSLNQCERAVAILQRGLPLIDADDAKTRAAYDEALRSCGNSSGLPAVDTQVATAAATAPAITPTPKKK